MFILFFLYNEIFCSQNCPVDSIFTRFLAKEEVYWLSSKSLIPRYVLEKAVEFRSEFLKNNSLTISDLKILFFYDVDGESCLEGTIVPIQHFWDKILDFFFLDRTWVFSVSHNFHRTIGQNHIEYMLTRKRHDEAEIRIEERRKDLAFAEIEKIILPLANDHVYDFNGVYDTEVKFRYPYIKKLSCYDYADLIVREFRGHPLVERVEKHEGGNHAWNVIVLYDGRKLYTDLTWYSGVDIDDEGYFVDSLARDPVDLTFNLTEFNTLGGAIDMDTGSLVKVHFAYNESEGNLVKREKRKLRKKSEILNKTAEKVYRRPKEEGESFLLSPLYGMLAFLRRIPSSFLSFLSELLASALRDEGGGEEMNIGIKDDL